jgi:hypothetical protein
VQCRVEAPRGGSPALALPPALPPTHPAYLDAVVTSQIVLIDRLEPACDGVGACGISEKEGGEGRRRGKNRVQIGAGHHTQNTEGNKNVPTSSWVWQTRWTFSLVSSLCAKEGKGGGV